MHCWMKLKVVCVHIAELLLTLAEIGHTACISQCVCDPIVSFPSNHFR